MAYRVRSWILLATIPVALSVMPAGAEESICRPPEPLQAGAAAVCVTPPQGTSLLGYFMKIGDVSTVHDDLYAKALVLDDGQCRIALVICDMTVIGEGTFGRAKKLIQDRVGLPGEHVMMACTHTHSACRVPLLESATDLRYVDQLVEGLAQSVCLAVDNLAQAEVATGSVDVPEYAFNRRWYMKPASIPADPFGIKEDLVRFNPPRGHADLIKPAGPVDPEVSILAVRHTNGRPLAVLANYSLHYVGGFKRAEVSADYFGVFSRKITELLDAESVEPAFVGMMSNATSGNIGAGVDFSKKGGKKFAPYERMEEVGTNIAEKVAGAIRDFQYERTVRVGCAESTIEVRTRRPSPERLAWAQKVLANSNAKYGHHWTRNYAREAIYLNEWPETVAVKLQAFRIGDCLIGAIPNEVFAETGLAVKEASPTENAFVVELANQYYGYLPTPEQHALGGYETWDARSSSLDVDAEPEIRATLISLMRQISEVP
jgi:neutral ceramidase